jgi:hypothetical protein
MRSGVIVQPGEVNSCVGCHEDRLRTPPTPASYRAAALQRPPSGLDGWFGPPRDFCFMREVQPVFDRRCVSCHDFGTEAGRVVNLAADRTLVFNVAYMELHRKGYLGVVGGGPNGLLEAKSWGSHASRLVQRLEQSACGEHLESEEKHRILAWIDLNAPYYPTHASAWHEGPAGRGPLTPDQLKELTRLTGRKISLRHGAPPLLSFDRPGNSPILEGLEQRDPAAHAKALAIIRAGAEALRQRPRADMPGFQPAPADQRRREKYERLTGQQRAVLNALSGGYKVYDR